MKLIEVQVRMFRNILDSTVVSIDPKITCLVGKNESGKTAFLEALYRLKPARPNAPFVIHEQYPAWLEKSHRQRGINLQEVQPIQAVFQIEAEDKQPLEGIFGTKALSTDRLSCFPPGLDS